jgi:transposase
MAEPVVVGIDVSKAKLELAVLPSGEQFTVGNDRAGIASLMERAQSFGASGWCWRQLASSSAWQ